MEFYHANIQEKNQLLKEINNNFLQQGYLTFQDLKKKNGYKNKRYQKFALHFYDCKTNG